VKSMNSAAFTYSGRDNLVAMQEAHHYNDFLQQLVVKHAPPKGKWLDFGAGAGQFAIPLKQAGNDVVAVEVDPTLAQSIARKGVPTYNALEQVPDESVDYVYALNVLEHIAEDANALRMLQRKLRPGGKLLIYVPAFQGLYSSMDALVGHCRRYDKAGLRAVVQQAGFQVESVEYADVLGYFASLVYKCLPGRDGTITPGSVALYDRWVFPLSRGLDRIASPWLGKNVYLVAHK
jgi:ubiquinone/menaquinone biosynthesis C-methylase UbiE